MNATLRRAAVAAVAATAALSLAGCGSGAPSTADAAVVQVPLLAKDDAIAAKVPEAIRAKGTLVIASDATAPPNQSIAPDGKTMIGNEVDFGNQLASILGLRAEFVNISFDSIIPGLQAGRYDTALSGMRDTKKREEVVDFVTYAKAGPQLFAKKQNADKITALDQLCGHTFAVQAGTLQEDVTKQQSAACQQAGKPAVDVKTFRNQADQVQAVSSGQVEVGAQNLPNNVYLAEQTNGALVGVGAPFAEGPWGMPVPKASGLAPALHEAVQKLISSPQYGQILQRWNVQDQAIDASAINGATS